MSRHSQLRKAPVRLLTQTVQTTMPRSMKFTEVLAAANPHEDGIRLSVPPSWHQGRTAYGGFSAALALEAARQVGGDMPPLRSASVSFVGPLYGDVDYAARVLRRGKNATWISVEARRGEEVGLVASFVFMGPVKSAVHLNDRPPPDGLVPVNHAKILAPHPLMPMFLRERFEVRFALPRSPEPKAEVCWWVKLKDEPGLDPMQTLLLVADCLPPGVMPLLSASAPASSMIWQVNLLMPAPRTRDGWWLLRSTGDYAENGCSSQRMDVWNADGEPVMAGVQSVAIFG
jgi:acyl-CoA thioesterase